GTSHLPPDRIQAPRTLASTSLGAAPFVEEALRWTGQPVGGQLADEAAPIDRLEPAPVPLQRARILLADDNADMRDYLHRLLGQRWSVDAVRDGRQAL